MNLTEASAFLGLNPRTLRLAVERGEIEGDHPLLDGPWVFKRQALETEAAANLVRRARRGDQTPALPESEQGDLGFSTT